MNYRDLSIEVGDFVEIRSVMGRLYVVLEINDYTEDGLTDIDCELAQVFPPQRRSDFLTKDLIEVKLYARKGTKTHDKYMKDLVDDRNRRGWGVADYIEILQETTDGVEPVFIDVDYSSFKTIDECLDALNDLDYLYAMFEEQEYLNKKETVINRLTELIE